MNASIPIAVISLLLVSCHASVSYRLSPDMDGSRLTLEGTVLSTEADGDFLLETNGKLALVDADDSAHHPEMGDLVRVVGTVDADEGEAPELDAYSVTSISGDAVRK